MAALTVASLYFVLAPHSVMREGPAVDTKPTSELYFSEQVRVLKEQDGWAYIENMVDGYKGWVKKSTLCSRESDYPATLAKVNRLKAHIYHVQDTEYGPMASLPFESKLEVVQRCSERWIEVALPDGKHAFIQSGDVTFEDRLLTKAEICALSRSFLGLPYTWGGRCSYDGFDCSGFVQMLYRQMGIRLPRDSKDQEKWEGFLKCDVSELEPGDLVYWGMSQTDIRHVGLLLEGGQFIHATVRENKPYLRISSLTDREFNGSGYYPYRTARKLNSTFKEKL